MVSARSYKCSLFVHRWDSNFDDFSLKMYEIHMRIIIKLNWYVCTVYVYPKGINV